MVEEWIDESGLADGEAAKPHWTNIIDNLNRYFFKQIEKSIKNREIKQIDESGLADGEAAKQHWPQSRQRHCQSHWHTSISAVYASLSSSYLLIC